MDANTLQDKQQVIKTDLHDAEIGETFYTLEPLPDTKFAKAGQYVYYEPFGSQGLIRKFRIAKCVRKTAYACTFQYLKKADVTEDILNALDINDNETASETVTNWDDI